MIIYGQNLLEGWIQHYTYLLEVMLTELDLRYKRDYKRYLK